MIMSGFAKKGVRLDTIKMVKHPMANLEYCQKVVGGLMSVKPNITVKHEEKIECIFTKLNDGDDWFADDTFMIQCVINWPRPSKCSYQVWHLGDVCLKKIAEHWS